MPTKQDATRKSTYQQPLEVQWGQEQAVRWALVHHLAMVHLWLA